MRYNGTSWVIVGIAGFSTASASPDLVLDSNDTAYVAYWNGYQGQFVVMKMVAPHLALHKAGPIDAASGVAANPTLSWGASNGPASYAYCLTKSNGGTCDTSWVSAGNNTSVSLTGLKSSTTYYWQARAVANGETAYADTGAWWSFTTGANSWVYLPALVR